MRVENIKFGYDESRLALDNISCSFERGKITSIIGANGCGKSTLLALCNRIGKPFAGSILLDNKPIYEYSNREFAQTVALVTQSHNSKIDLNVYELVSYGRWAHKRRFAALSDDDDKIISEAISACELGGFERRRVSELSGGERQRVYLAMALARQPRILFLDEPTTFLDIHHQIGIMNIIQRINISKGITVVMVLHDINQAIKYSDNIVIMREGRIVASGNAKTTISTELIDDIYMVESMAMETTSGDTIYIPNNIRQPIKQSSDSADRATDILQDKKSALRGRLKKPLSRKRKMINALLVAAGFVSLGLGFVGLVTLLPTFPFLLLTLVCFSAGSDRFAGWFKGTRLYIKYLEAIVLTKSMTLPSKIKTLLIIIGLIMIPIITVNVLPMRIFLVLIIIMHFFIFFVRIKTVTRAELGERVREGRERERIKQEQRLRDAYIQEDVVETQASNNNAE